MLESIRGQDGVEVEWDSASIAHTSSAVNRADNRAVQLQLSMLVFDEAGLDERGVDELYNVQFQW